MKLPFKASLTLLYFFLPRESRQLCECSPRVKVSMSLLRLFYKGRVESLEFNDAKM
jgi:hypothetical protein